MNGFVAAVSFVFGLLAWLQLPAVCGFMLSSTLVGPDNYIYSIWLGVLIAGIGLASAPRGPRRGNPLLAVAFVLNVAFILCAIFAHAWYAHACRAIYVFFTPG
jgi:hypothetical protein